MSFDLKNIKGREPLVEYPWRCEVDKLLNWLLDKDDSTKAFFFDVIMSAAYIDATPGIEKNIEECSNAPSGFNSHLGFINLCSPCYISQDIWVYQKAVKPQSGALGKLSSEIILRFIEKLSNNLDNVLVIGGVEYADAALFHIDGTVILSEVKSAPLLTYPFVFNVEKSSLNGNHEKFIITNSQMRACESGMYFHNVGTVNLGKVGSELWPFKPLIDFFIDDQNKTFTKKCVDEWLIAKDTYIKKDRDNKMYYLTNACGSPPQIAKSRDNWPKKESISDSKTSAGMDRTDDIKKGIYQTIKIGTVVKGNSNIKTAIISNLPAYRHQNEYVDPFVEMLWGVESDFVTINGSNMLTEDSLHRIFDFIITLENPVLRDVKL